MEEKKNPIKLAAAIKYDAEKNVAPMIVAKGKGSIAEEIIRLAEEHEIPLYQDPTLAKLLSSLDLETEIPPDLYTLVAEVLAFVYRLEQKKKGSSSKFEKLKAKPTK